MSKTFRVDFDFTSRKPLRVWFDPLKTGWRWLTLGFPTWRPPKGHDLSLTKTPLAGYIWTIIADLITNFPIMCKANSYRTECLFCDLSERLAHEPKRHFLEIVRLKRPDRDFLTLPASQEP